MLVVPDSRIRRSDAILVLTSGLKSEVAAGRGLDPETREPTACSASASGRPSELASSLACVFVCRLAASEGGCNTPDPRFIFRRVCVCVCVHKERESKLKREEGKRGGRGGQRGGGRQRF